MDKEYLYNLQSNSKKRHLIVGLLILIIVSVFALFSDHGLIPRLNLELEKNELIKKIENENSLNDSLNNLKHTLLNDTFEIERIAREKYGFIKEGEEIYFIDE